MRPAVVDHAARQPAIRRVALMLLLVYAVQVIAATVIAFSGLLMPAELPWSPLAATLDAILVLGSLCIAGGVFGGWKAMQLALGRGDALANTWTLCWLALFGLTALAAPLRLAAYLLGA